jgi:hypothetical protein
LIFQATGKCNTVLQIAPVRGDVVGAERPFSWGGRDNPGGGVFLQWAFANSFSLGLGRTERGVSYFATSQAGRYSPVRFFKMKESLDAFSAQLGESRVGEFFKRKQGRLGMKPAVP